jgi:hypothetical protein
MLGLAVMAIGIAVIVGMSPVKGLRMIGGIIFWIIVSPFVEALFSYLPLWLTLLVLGFFAIQIARMVLTFVFGEEATGHVMGALIIGAGRFLGRLCLLPFRAVLGLSRTVIRLSR